MAASAKALGLLALGTASAAAVSLRQAQPSLFLPGPIGPLYEPGGCPFYEKCGEDCIGTLFRGKQMAPEAKQLLESLDPKKTIVWSFGLSADVSVDLALACKFNFTVHMFDPFPGVPQHMEAVQSLVGTMETTHPMTTPSHEGCDNCNSYWDDVSHSSMRADQVVFHDKGIASSDTSLTAYETETGWALNPKKQAPGGTVASVPAYTLAHLMQDTSTDRIDVMRIDFDGVEDTILDQVAALPEQALPKVIFAQLPSYSEWTCKGEVPECKGWKKKTKASIERIKARGYTSILYHHMEFTFLRPK